MKTLQVVVSHPYPNHLVPPPGFQHTASTIWHRMQEIEKANQARQIRFYGGMLIATLEGVISPGLLPFVREPGALARHPNGMTDDMMVCHTPIPDGTVIPIGNFPHLRKWLREGVERFQRCAEMQNDDTSFARGGYREPMPLTIYKEARARNDDRHNQAA